MAKKNIKNKKSGVTVKSDSSFNGTNLLGYFALALIIVSLANIGMRMTGMALSDTATVNVTVESTASITFTTNNINFGSGAVNLSAGDNATLFSNGTAVSGGNWSAVNQHFVLENNGNKNVTLDLLSSKSAQQLLGGTNPVFQYMLNSTALNSGSCFNGTESTGVFYDVNATAPGTRICGVFGSDDNLDEIDINIKLVIPSDSLTGSQGSIFTATATAIP